MICLDLIHLQIICNSVSVELFLRMNFLSKVVLHAFQQLNNVQIEAASLCICSLSRYRITEVVAQQLGENFKCDVFLCSTRSVIRYFVLTNWTFVK